MLTFVLLCLQGTGGQAYAQEDKAGERRIRYSSSYLKEAEIPEAPEEYLEEGEITYRLVGTEIEAVPVRGRTREVSGEISTMGKMTNMCFGTTPSFKVLTPEVLRR